MDIGSIARLLRYPKAAFVFDALFEWFGLGIGNSTKFNPGMLPVRGEVTVNIKDYKAAKRLAVLPCRRWKKAQELQGLFAMVRSRKAELEKRLDVMDEDMLRKTEKKNF